MSLPLRKAAAAAWFALAILAGSLATGALGLSALERLPLCLFKLATGIPCPGCGMTHALLAAFQGDWAASWASHALGLPLLAVWTWWLIRGGERLPKMRPVIGAALVALVLGTYGLRFVG